ncbi:MAG: ABC transporter permease subunit [Proteobacteria bacterium]|jgi:hypothetical protein|nr:ABC transporter permease subunit [Pseudomonadota bacterium]
MSPLTSFYDTWLVARFELLRNLRTWRAIALCTLYTVATTGGAYIFTRILLAFENTAAGALGVPTTKKPGTMTKEIVDNPEMQAMFREMLPSSDLVDYVMSWPLLTTYHLWFALAFIPFLAASTAGECVATDRGTGAIRFECLRTGRVEVVAGRFIGQAFLMAVAALLAVAGTWCVGMLAMVGNNPVTLLFSLILVTPRVVVCTLPFLAIGVAFSQVTTSPNLARVLAIGTVMGTWIVGGIATIFKGGDWWMIWSFVELVLPQQWMGQLWSPLPDMLPGMMVLLLLSVGYASLGFVFFGRADL